VLKIFFSIFLTVFIAVLVFSTVYFLGFGGRFFDRFREKTDTVFISAFNNDSLGFRSIIRKFFPEYTTWGSPWFLRAEVNGTEPLYSIVGVLLEYDVNNGILVIRRYNGIRTKVLASSSLIMLQKLKTVDDGVVSGGFSYFGKVGDNMKLCRGDRLEIITNKISIFGDIISKGNIFLGPTACANENL